MGFLFFEIWVWLLVMALVGLGFGWLVWGRALSRNERKFEVRLDRMRSNWEEVEARLAAELDHVAALEQERHHLREQLEQFRRSRLSASASGSKSKKTKKTRKRQSVPNHGRLVSETP